MSNNVDLSDSSRALILAAVGLVYLYFTLSFRCLGAGLPVLIGLSLHWLMEHPALLKQTRSLLAAFVFTNFTYWISSTSYILYPICASFIWSTILGISCYRFEVFRKPLATVNQFGARKVQEFENKVNNFRWPILDFDGKGILAFTGSTLDLSQMTFIISGIDFSFEVDQHTKIIARVETLGLRLARDVTVKEIYLNVRGDGTPPSEAKSFSTPVRTNTSASVASRTSVETSVSSTSVGSDHGSPLRKLPPLPPVTSDSPHLLGLRSNTATSTSTPPPLPPRLPPRKSSNASVSALPINDYEDTDEEADFKRAVEASLADHPVSTSTTTKADHNPDHILATDPEVGSTTNASPSRTASDSSFFHVGDDTEDAGLRAALDESAIHHSSSIEDPDHNDFDMKAAIAASLEDQTAYHKKNMRERRIRLSELLAKIPWWLKITPGALVTRLILSPIIWLHPITVSSVAGTGTGKRITNLLETSGLKKAHPNQEIFKLIRKVFLWLESGDVSLVLNDITVRPHIPLSADHDVRIDVRAAEPTAYRNSNGTEEILAKIHAISASLSIPIFLLPNHEQFIPTSPRSSIPFSILLSMPGVFNRELLTIGAAFAKATTMMDLRHTAQSRPSPAFPSLHRASGGTSQFSFKSLGLAVKQAAGDLAKQKGVEWGVRDAEIAKWTAKLARLMSLVKVDVGGQGEIPVDLYKLRRAATSRRTKNEQE
ncbi:protein of unknown function [Taphrina deformans PYCC 5710]|uniref:Uncharacterized protein n=1 Tax=Taphrina deformans (strain PYCC 5710 / ATCC 11124 / CBS 356.35 / IMI 108563 / JCM 9778 / NBRC 8474) TaxID=1097556 RepID=R4XGJ9_TAPDE|nr:protein of unknown function [Taphrina deformans PYCC 5710]|eukprot:CCG82494.1 protein of unknown function [Taphrina deformans PYCC 5710]